MNDEDGRFKAKNIHYKYCFVPLCKNTTYTTPGKLFISVPKDLKRRKSWFKAARRDATPNKAVSSLHCCEDHFNMQEDAENYMRHMMMGGNLLIKKDCVPHIFDCQPTRLATSLTPRGGSKKRNAARLVADALAAESTSTSPNFDEVNADGPSVSEAAPPVPSINDSSPEARTRDVGTQVRLHYRSKATMCTPFSLGLLSSTQTSPLKSVGTSPLKSNIRSSPPKPKVARLTVDMVYTDTSEESENEVGVDTCDLQYSTESSETETSDDEIACAVAEETNKRVCLEQTRRLSKKEPMRYLGVPIDSLYILDSLSGKLNYRGSWLERQDIVMLVFRKIRLNESFGILGDCFGISTSHAAKLFAKFCPVLARFLKQLVRWPQEESIRRLIPTAFQARYGRVQSIIDCFEVEIEKPTNAVYQSLTWSEYKKCNTLKFLVSVTPDGVINFVSKGYGGRVSDMVLLEDSGYMEKLSPGMSVMADRGFKHIKNSIKAKGCTLVRPPSVSAGEKLNAFQCKETKRIASLRIHVERLIRRIREFKMLVPHSCIDIHLLNKLDNCVIIAAGLINLQGPLIR